MFKRRRGGILDVIVLIIAGLALVFLLLGSAQRAVEVSNRIQCAANLRQLGQGMLIYANDNKQRYPRTLWASDAPPTQFTGASAPSPWTPGGVAANDVTAAMFLLMTSEQISPQRFICPSTDRTPAAATGSNFPSEANLSYSMANPYPGKDVAYMWNCNLPATFVLLADMNPGYNSSARFCANAPQNSTDAEHMTQGNSPNHADTTAGTPIGLVGGQNVLFADGHVEWALNPFVGDNNDNIFTASDGPVGPNYTDTTANAVSPRFTFDTIALPGVTMSVGHSNQYLWLLAEGFLAILAAFSIVRLVRGRRKPAGVSTTPGAGNIPPPPPPPPRQPPR